MAPPPSRRSQEVLHAISRALVRTAAAPDLSAGRPDGIAQEHRPPPGRELAHPAALRGQRNAPHAVYLTLWFESRWGLATLHAQAFNEAQHARAWVASLERECERLRGVIRALENAQGQAAANSAVFNAF
ncbi:hypothetical protein [Variovorax sp. WS11]|uniref:hypothetical protein n=1 Tax=Variovorax sp. WS11 TaxID=1105204 RepID=UPI0011B26BF9|nr:hypothetical protein [Variovorax sp. WS11]